MPKICYEPLNMRRSTLEVVDRANEIIALYAAQGYSLTLRQLYYQFVSRDLIANKQSEYSRLGDIVSKARRAGMIDWGAIEDRTRSLRSLATWDSPESIVGACAKQFRYDLWDDQPHYVEVYFEKDALMGVFERICNELRVPYFSCRGYTSDSEMWVASQRLRKQAQQGKEVVVLHFGDHDPSGIDMTRDIRDRLALFGAVPGYRRVSAPEVNRLALNMDQIDEYDPPPNPAKDTDSRFEGYRALYGDESWELDALEPTVLAALVRDAVEELLDEDAWAAAKDREDDARSLLTAVAEKWDDVTDGLA